MCVQLQHFILVNLPFVNIHVSFDSVQKHIHSISYRESFKMDSQHKLLVTVMFDFNESTAETCKSQM